MSFFIILRTRFLLIHADRVAQSVWANQEAEKHPWGEIDSLLGCFFTIFSTFFWKILRENNEKFSEYLDQIPKSDFVTSVLEGKMSYNQIKLKSEPYQKIKNQLYASMKKSGVGIWVKKPEEIEEFFPKRSTLKTEMKMEN